MIAAIVSMGSLTLFLKFWHPKEVWTSRRSREGADGEPCRGREAARRHGFTRAQVLKAWTPWAILSVLVFLWGLPQIKTWLNALSAPSSRSRACTTWW